MTSSENNNNLAGPGQFYIGTVSAITTTGIKIQLDGESAPMEKTYKRIYTVRTGDRVLILKLNGTYVVIGPLYPNN